jgi:hypothetical protein
MRNFDAAAGIDIFFVSLFIGSSDIIYVYGDVTCYVCARNKSTDRLCCCRCCHGNDFFSHTTNSVRLPRSGCCDQTRLAIELCVRDPSAVRRCTGIRPTVVTTRVNRVRMCRCPSTRLQAAAAAAAVRPSVKKLARLRCCLPLHRGAQLLLTVCPSGGLGFSGCEGGGLSPSRRPTDRPLGCRPGAD